METSVWHCVSQAPEVLGESAVWSVAERALYWVAIRGQAVVRLDTASGRIARFAFDELVGGVVLEASGTVLVALRESIVRLDPASGRREPVITLEQGLPENRLNEFKCDPRGRLWCGSMWDFGEQVRGSLYVIGPDWRVHIVRRDIGIPNGLAFSTEQDRVYFADSQKEAIEYAPLSAEAGRGAVLAWTALVGPGVLPGRPDGAALDADGYLWSARPRGGCIARIAPDGRVDRLLKLPVTHATSCAFGGPDLDVLYVTTLTQRLSPQDLRAQPLAGHVLATRPGVRGVPEPLFSPVRPLP